MTKIAIVTQSYPDPSQIPSSNHIKSLFGGDTVVICRSARPELVTNRPYLVARTGAARGDWSAVLHEQLPNVLSGLSGRVPVGRNRRHLEAFLQAYSVQHVLAEFGTEGVWIWPIVKRLGLPFHVYFRGYDATAFLEHSRRRPGRVRAYKAMLEEADTVFSVSQFLFRQLEGYGLNLSNGLVIPSGVDTLKFAPVQKDPELLVAAGRFI
jgi:glycosyltransferase involved in cell wall biosynthesis